jgi:hypothetical protein
MLVYGVIYLAAFASSPRVKYSFTEYRNNLETKIEPARVRAYFQLGCFAGCVILGRGWRDQTNLASRLNA